MPFCPKFTGARPAAQPQIPQKRPEFPIPHPAEAGRDVPHPKKSLLPLSPWLSNLHWDDLSPAERARREHKLRESSSS